MSIGFVVEVCDWESQDLYETVEEICAEGLPYAYDENIFYIDSLEMTKDLVDSKSLSKFLAKIPCFVFQYTGVKPCIVCYLVASDDFYESAACDACFDERSVDGSSPSLFMLK